MIRFPLRAFSYISLFVLILLFKMFAGLDNDIIISIAIMGAFLILFTYIFNTEGHTTLNVFIFLSAFIVLPVFILLFLGILDSFPAILGGILYVLIVIFFGVLSVISIVKLNFVEIEYTIDDER